MAKFYGQVWAERGVATRMGHHCINTSAQSYDGSISTHLSYDNDKLMVTIAAAKDESTAYGRTVFYGTFDEYIKKLES